jgi:uncharacterized protein (TIGR03437 family)
VALDSGGALYIADYCRVRKVSDGVITTVAGNGILGESGDGGPATAAMLGAPLALAVDSSGDLYIAEPDRIRKVSGGTITTIASLFGPQAMTFDSDGNLYIAQATHQIRKITRGVITTVAGNGTAGFSGDGGPATAASLNYPDGIAVDSAGNLYIADGGNNRIRKVTGQTISTLAGNSTAGFAGDNGPASSASLLGPYGVAVDSQGNIFIADSGNIRVRKVSGGIISTVAGNGGFGGDGIATAVGLNQPRDVAADSSGNIYISDVGERRIRKVAAGKITTVAGNGTVGFVGDGGPAINASLVNPVALAVDAAGAVYVADPNDQRIRKISGGVITTVVGNGTEGLANGVPATGATISFPLSVAIDPSGKLFLTDYRGLRVCLVSGGTISQVVDGTTPGFVNAQRVVVNAVGDLYLVSFSVIQKVSGGKVTIVAGIENKTGFSGDGGPAMSAMLNSPSAVAVDSTGNLYIADTGNDRIRKVSNGIITTIAGTGVAGFAGDGGLATKAAIDTPTGIAVDSRGNIYFVDSRNQRVREILVNSKPSFQTSPDSLSSSVSSGVVTGSRTINLSSSIPGLAYSTSVSDPWLAVEPSNGTLPAALQVTVDPSGLAPGSYNATIAIKVPDASPSDALVSVSLIIAPSTAAALGVDTAKVSFTASRGSADVSQVLRILNTGGGTLNFTASSAVSTGGSWLSISLASGTATSSSPAPVTVTASLGTLAPGTYTGTITVSGAGKSISIQVTLSVSAPSATILLSQSALSFTAVAGGGVPLPQNFGILNIGQGSLNWTATATTLTGGNWLQVGPGSGNVQRPYLDVSLVDVTIDPSTLAQGTYYGRIQVSGAAANSPQLMTIILTVLPAGTTLGAQVFPAGLIFTGVAGGIPGSQDVQVGNPAGTATSFISGIVGSGLDYLPKSATLQPNRPTTVRVYPDLSQVSPGSIQQGTITLQFSDRSPSQTINVLTVVAPSGGGSLSPHAGGARASGCGSPGPLVVFRTPQPSQSTFGAVVGQATTMEVQVSDGCGNLVMAGGQNTNVTASFSNGDSVPLTHIGSGVWQGTWRPLNAGTVSMFVTAFAVQGGNVVGGQSSTLTAVVSAPATVTPTVTDRGVVHAASAQSGVPIAPGGLITVYGLNLADSAGSSPGLPLSHQLNGTQVFLGNQPLPILFTSAGQVNVQVPYGVPVNTQYQLTVQHGNALSAPQSLVVAQAEPGIFTVNQAGSGQGSIVKSDGVTLAQPATPASIGETVVIYCTGLGTVTPKVAEGVPASSTPPLSTTDNPVSVTIGGKAATVTFAGLTPGDPGLYQINAVVPSGILIGDAVPVVISVAGQTSPISPAVTMAVK